MHYIVCQSEPAERRSTEMAKIVEQNSKRILNAVLALKESFSRFLLAPDERHTSHYGQDADHQQNDKANTNGLVGAWTKPWTNIVYML